MSREGSLGLVTGTRDAIRAIAFSLSPSGLKLGS